MSPFAVAAPAPICSGGPTSNGSISPAFAASTAPTNASTPQGCTTAVGSAACPLRRASISSNLIFKSAIATLLFRFASRYAVGWDDFDVLRQRAPGTLWLRRTIETWVRRTAFRCGRDDVCLPPGAGYRRQGRGGSRRAERCGPRDRPTTVSG